MLESANKHLHPELEDSNSISLQIQPERKELTTHVDFNLKMDENQKKLQLFIQLDGKMVQNLTREITKQPNGFEDERKLHNKNCIFTKKIQTPNSQQKGSFFINFTPYKGLSFNAFFNPEFQDLLTYSRMKVHYCDTKWRVKWLECQYESPIFSSMIPVHDIPFVLKEKLLIEMMFEKRRTFERGFIGIENEGNTCYINSILQVFYYIIPVRKIILEKEVKSENKLLQSLQELFISLWKCKGSANASNVLKYFGTFCEDPYRQQDIHEFLIHFITKLEEFCPELKNLWSGKDYQVIRSKDDRYQSKQKQDFNQLELHMTDTQSNNFENIKQSLLAILKEENVDEKIETDEYGKLAVVKTRYFEYLPPVLFMNVKRYEFNTKRRQLSKVCLDLDYPETINLDFLIKNQEQLDYILYAVTVHKGRTPYSGHYFSFVNVSKDQNKPEWYEFNDRYVTKVKTEKIYQFTGKKRREIYLHETYGKWCQRMVYSEETAYLLVYMRKDLFRNHQSSQIKFPDWFLQKEKQKLTESEQKTKCIVKYYAPPDDSFFDPFSDEIELNEAKIDKRQSIESEFQKIEAFIGFKVGTVWRVNKTSRKIKYVGKKLGAEYKFTMDTHNRTRNGFKITQYFLVLPFEKCSIFGRNIGILQVVRAKQQERKKIVYVKEKREICLILDEVKKEGQTAEIEQNDVESFLFGWNDYLFVKVNE